MDEVLGGLVLDPYAEVPARALEDLHHGERVDAQVVDERRVRSHLVHRRPCDHEHDLRELSVHLGGIHPGLT